jgi:hypothetical protein
MLTREHFRKRLFQKHKISALTATKCLPHVLWMPSVALRRPPGEAFTIRARKVTLRRIRM